jgi:fused signal recognition particle receptor
MDELRKLRRVAKPDFTIFVADSLTGNDAVEQAREFSERIGYDFSILAKADVDHKGGAILSVSYISQKPIAFLGVGQAYEDFEPFDKEKLLAKLIK